MTTIEAVDPNAAATPLTAPPTAIAKNAVASSLPDSRRSNALAPMPRQIAKETAKAIQTRMEALKKDFPKGVDYRVVYDTTVFIDESVKSVFHTLFEVHRRHH